MLKRKNKNTDCTLFFEARIVNEGKENAHFLEW